MSYYQDVYKKRLNRYGNDYHSRMQGKREKVFECDLERSVFRIDFEHDGEMIPAILERYKQDETETLQYLRTRTDVQLKPGTIFTAENRKGDTNHWMVYWLEQIASSGYHKYVVLRLTHDITWKARDGKEYTVKAYMYGQEDNMLKDELRSRSRMDTVYGENLKLNFFITPTHAQINKDDYFEIIVKDSNDVDIVQPYRVTGYDIISTPGVEYVSVDPVYIFNKEPVPKVESADEITQHFWFDPTLSEE